MPVERASGGTSLIDVLDRVLDKGIVIDAWVRVSLVGIDLLTVEARVVVASIDTYIKYSEAVSQVPSVSRPAIEARSSEDLLAENAALRAQLAAAGAKSRPWRRRPAGRGPRPSYKPWLTSLASRTFHSFFGAPIRGPRPSSTSWTPCSRSRRRGTARRSP